MALFIDVEVAPAGRRGPGGRGQADRGLPRRHLRPGRGRRRCGSSRTTSTSACSAASASTPRRPAPSPSASSTTTAPPSRAELGAGRRLADAAATPARARAAAGDARRRLAARRRACAGHVDGGADAVGARRRARARRGRARAVGGAHAGQDVGDARHAAPAARRRAEPVDRGPRTRIERQFLNRARQKYFGFTHDEAVELIDAIGEALDGRELTRAELAAAVGDERLLESWGSMLKPAAAAGELVFAPARARRCASRGRLVARGSRGGARRGVRRYLGAGAAGDARGRRALVGHHARRGRAGARGARRRGRARDGRGTPMLLLREHVAEAAAAEPLRCGAAAAGLRPVRDRGDAARRAADAGRVQGARAPPAGLDLPRAARRRASWPASGATSARASGCSSGSSRSRRAEAARARPPRRRPSGSPASSAARSSWPGAR